MKDTRDRLATRAATATTLEDFFTAVVAESAAAHSVVTLLSTDITAAPALAGLRDAVATLLNHDQTHARVRTEVRLDEVMALLTAASQGALTAAWPADLQARTASFGFLQPIALVLSWPSTSRLPLPTICPRSAAGHSGHPSAPPIRSCKPSSPPSMQLA
ncbi:hypothetical protein J2S43_007623 [Catenuloplanes nepalensis]|uniref:Transcriptional regulator SbtR-like C-terminal domain-containing protein n=1 Tax=Catenuloplanes nepalensis TaxID=587533 RepID=A0ABT9N6P5_9ACTN|nr:hypothetical protein [Catenuloplanes nepalensis]MDP9799111.1 hypothetical protein [Catenuloplanes nepalensis]